MLLDKTFSDDFLPNSSLYVGYGLVKKMWYGLMVKHKSRANSVVLKGWGVKATTTELLFVPQDEPNLAINENYFDVYKVGFEGSDTLYKTTDFVSTSELEVISKKISTIWLSSLKLSLSKQFS